MELATALAHAPLLGYVLAILALFAATLPRQRARFSAKSVLFLALAAASLCWTWKHMLYYAERSFVEAALRANVRLRSYSTTRWLQSTSLFEEAWSLVCVEKLRWFISEQLCAFAAPLTVFFSREASRKSIKRPWAYMLLGQLVAISVGQALFLAAVVAPSPRRKLGAPPQGRNLAVPPTKPSPARPSLLLVASVAISIATVVITPSVNATPFFLPNLLIMHALLVVPLFFTPTSKGPVSYSRLYSFLAIASLLNRLRLYSALDSIPTDLASVQEFANSLYRTFYSHPAQSSISADVVCTTLSFLIWMLVDFRRKSILEWAGLIGLICATPVLGIATISSTYLAWRESWVEGLPEGRTTGSPMQSVKGKNL